MGGETVQCLSFSGGVPRVGVWVAEISTLRHSLDVLSYWIKYEDVFILLSIWSFYTASETYVESKTVKTLPINLLISIDPF
ncbi:hypothetical protein E2C01_014232 [Portunus trituberculatus]|uniref:Uncharacterized protein n=1 Tax=Portunus trituberculatus TaxID=210409 RepID=A0A5B7DJB4_PORTR|nr:hypothetical protein [Portunus trituberculatus]